MVHCSLLSVTGQNPLRSPEKSSWFVDHAPATASKSLRSSVQLRKLPQSLLQPPPPHVLSAEPAGL
jgi:hypothetical protein